MSDQNIISQIKEAEKLAEIKIQKTIEEENDKLNELKKEKENQLANIEKNAEPKIRELYEQAEKDIKGAKLIHEQELENKLKQLNEIPQDKINKAVEFVLGQIDV